MNSKSIILVFVLLCIIVTSVLVMVEHGHNNIVDVSQETPMCDNSVENSISVFVDRVKLLKRGMKRKSVTRTLGKPDEVHDDSVTSSANWSYESYFFEDGGDVLLLYRNNRLYSASLFPEGSNSVINLLD